MMTLSEEVEYWKAEAANLREVVADLTGRGKYKFPVFPGLKYGALRILEALLDRPHVSVEALHAALYSHRFHQPQSNIITVYVSLLRKALKPYGCEIKNTHGIGYYIPPEQREHLRKLFAKKDQDDD